MRGEWYEAATGTLRRGFEIRGMEWKLSRRIEARPRQTS